MKACLVGKSGASNIFGAIGYNTYLGEKALKNTKGIYNTAVGHSALYSDAVGFSNTATGYCTLYSNTLGKYNTAMGDTALYKNTTGDGNTAAGHSALLNNSAGSYNTAVGKEALNYNTTGGNNAALGYMAGNMGTTAFAAQNSVYIGSYAKLGNDNAANEIVIGANATGGGSNTVTLGNNAITKLRCQVTTITALSDKRLKEEIRPADLNKCLEAVKKLPVTRYKYKNFTGTHVDKNVTGFMADDVEKVFPKAVSKTDQYFPVLDEKGNQVYEEVDGVKVAKTFLMEDVKDITMTEALPTLWGAVQSLVIEVEGLKAELKKYKK